MPKPLPPATVAALSPPPRTFAYTFFENVAANPLKAKATGLSVQNAWWLMDAAFLSYSPEPDIRAVYGGNDFGGPVAVQFFSGRMTTQCYVASTDAWIVLAFRGTQVDDFWASVVDWSVDARFFPVPDTHGDLVHAGFLDAINEVWSDVAGHIAGLQRAKARPLWVTGHSLGAALATIAANRCSDAATPLGLAGLYTFGSPRVGDKNFGNRITVPVWRVRHDADIVTHVPLGLVFRHVGVLCFIDGGGHWHPDPGAMEETLLEAGTPTLSPGEAHHMSSLLHLTGGDVPLPGALADHAPINYAIRLWNCYEANG
jgi:triacylglycerol lipase